MRLSAAQLKGFCLLGMLILLGQGALSFSDIDRTGWALVLVYLILIGLYVRLKRSALMVVEMSRRTPRKVLEPAQSFRDSLGALCDSPA